MQLRLVHAKYVANNIKTFWFDPEKPLDYTAGQFIEMHLPHKNTDNLGQKRWFTLSSSPTEKYLSITTKLANDSPSSFKRKLFNLKIGDMVCVSEPLGDFVLPIDREIPLIFIAGGIGITPYRSMIKWLCDNKQTRNIKLIYVTQNLNEMAFIELFNNYGVSPELLIKSYPDTKNINSNITHQIFQKLPQLKSKYLVYISGPEKFTEQLEKKFINIGLTKDRLVLDFFTGYARV